MYTRNATKNLVNRYKAVLKKCNLLNVFGTLAVASMLVSPAFVDNAYAVVINPVGGTIIGMDASPKNIQLSTQDHSGQILYLSTNTLINNGTIDGWVVYESIWGSSNIKSAMFGTTTLAVGDGTFLNVSHYSFFNNGLVSMKAQNSDEIKAWRAVSMMSQSENYFLNAPGAQSA